MTNSESFYDLFTKNESKEALFYGDGVFSYSQILTESISRLRVLEKEGITKGKRVLINPVERIEFFFSFLACSLVGADVISVNENVTSKELKKIIKISKPDFVWDAFNGSVKETDLKSNSFHNIKIIFFTSGTTSQPKAIVHEFSDLIRNADAFNNSTGLDSQVFMKHVFPTGYMAGLLNTFISPLLASGRVFLSARFSAKSALSFWQEAKNKGVNSLWLAPTMLSILSSLDRGEYKNWTKNHIKNVFVGTGPLYPSVKNEFEDNFGVKCLESYGMTECMFISASSRIKTSKEGFSGRLLKGVDCKIINDNKGPTNEDMSEGKIFIKSDYMMKGYLEKITKNNNYKLELRPTWLDTGDQGLISKNQIKIMGRIKDVIIRGGVNISSKLIEDILLSHEQIQEAAVIGNEHPVWGEEVIAFISLIRNSSINERNVLDFCKTKLSKEALPKKLIILDTLPVSSTGKITKNKLKELLV